MIHVADGVAEERAKYEEIWSDVPQYRENSPGLIDVDRFLRVLDPPRNCRTRLIDIGCGSGVAGLKFQALGLSVGWLDVTDAGLSEEVPRQSFIQAAVWASWPVHPIWDYGFCCSVLEHLPTEFVGLAITRILERCTVAWFNVALVPGEIDNIVGPPPTLRPYPWWLLRFATLGNIKDARDLCENGLFVVTR